MQRLRRRRSAKGCMRGCRCRSREQVQVEGSRSRGKASVVVDERLQRLSLSICEINRVHCVRPLSERSKCRRRTDDHALHAYNEAIAVARTVIAIR